MCKSPHTNADVSRTCPRSRTGNVHRVLPPTVVCNACPNKRSSLWRNVFDKNRDRSRCTIPTTTRKRLVSPRKLCQYYEMREGICCIVVSHHVSRITEFPAIIQRLWIPAVTRGVWPPPRILLHARTGLWFYRYFSQNISRIRECKTDRRAIRVRNT